MQRYRPIVYAAARALAADESAAREIADSLWAELYGLNERDGERRSLLSYFHGRASLATWLRAVVSQRHVDRWRERKRLQPLDDERARELPADGSADPASGDPDRIRRLVLIRDVVRGALDRLGAHDRVRLAAYYLDRRTLAEIGRALGEHESTVSRKLERTRRQLKKDIERDLRSTHGLADDEIAACYQQASEDFPFDLGLQQNAGATFKEQASPSPLPIGERSAAKPPGEGEPTP
jgi:RNA polymerase sigma-70 factor, ECF subfamily